MTAKKGNIHVQTQDIFPIIKKWLYSEHDIFLRELVANATDAITKRSTLGRIQNQEVPAGAINVRVNKDEKTITITDNGVGMSEEEIEKYIAHLAFSGAEEFVQKMKDAGETKDDIIGKFGLGFYSAFMVADKVVIDSLSMNDGAKAARWICEGDTEYTFEKSEKNDVGTTVTLHINEESKDFLNEWKITQTLRNYCDFMPYKIDILDALRPPTKALKEDGSVDEDAPEVAAKPTVINDHSPLWKRDPKEVTEEEYIAFFHKLYPTENRPLFWIHLKVDHPFTLEGILYFPKLNINKPLKENNIRLYCKQVFVSDNVKNVIPDFLGLLKGSIDSVDIPLNVSRSSLQGDPNIKKISNYIVKKVAEAMKVLFKKDRTRYETIWEDIHLFMKYGSMSDEKFDELMRDKILYKNSEGKYVTLGEYSESIPAEYKEKLKNKVVYFEKGKSDGSLRSQLLSAGIQTIETDDHIDPHFMQHAEMKKIGKEDAISFASVDSEISNIFDSEATTDDDIKIKELFSRVLATNSKKSESGKNEDDGPSDDGIEVLRITGATTPAYFKVDESMKRFSQMALSMGQNNSFPIKKTLVINPSNALIQNAFKLHEKGGHEDLVGKLCHYVEDLAGISSEGLKAENKEIFVKRSQDLMQELTGSLL